MCIFLSFSDSTSDFKKNLRMRIHDEKTELKVCSILQTLAFAILYSILLFTTINKSPIYLLACFFAFNLDSVTIHLNMTVIVVLKNVL